MNTERQQFLIQSQLISDNQRLAFLPKHLNKEYLSFESMVYTEPWVLFATHTMVDIGIFTN